MVSPSASRRAALLREHARVLADQAKRERRQDRARYMLDKAASYERAAAILEAPAAPTIWIAKAPKPAAGGACIHRVIAARKTRWG
jgi:hypothetical protein